MQLPKLTFGLLSLFVSSIFQVSAQSQFVWRITASNCEYNKNNGMMNFLTGFSVLQNGKPAGIMTALHGVCGCNEIKVFNANDSTAIYSVKINQADIANDVALLTHPDILSRQGGLTLFKGDPKTYGGKGISMISYPFGIEISLDTKLARIREMPSPLVALKKFLNQDLRSALDRRKSPSIGNSVLSVELEISKGCSGSPILLNNQVIGIANGGLKDGSTHVCWAIPVKNLKLSPIAKLGKEEYANLRKNDPNDLFVLTCGLDNSSVVMINTYTKRVISSCETERLCQQSFTDDESQYFKLQKVEGNNYNIIQSATGKYLTVDQKQCPLIKHPTTYDSSGQLVILSSQIKDDFFKGLQEWTIEVYKEDLYMIKNVKTQKTISVTQSGNWGDDLTKEGRYIEQFDTNIGLKELKIWKLSARK